MIKKINGTYFDLDYCKTLSVEKLKKVYASFGDETVKQLIDEVYPKEQIEVPTAKKYSKKDKTERSGV